MSAPQSRVESLTASAKGHAVDAYNYAQRSLDRVIEPDTRRKAYDASYAFASARPFVFSAAAFLLAFCALPVLLFSIFAVAVAATAVGGAILFALFWLALGLLVLVPTLFLAALLALLLWAWAAGTFVVGLAVYRTAVAWDARRRRAQSSQPQTPPQKPKSQSQSQTPTQTPPQHAVSLPVVADSKLGYKQPPPIPQYRPEKKATNGQGLEYTAIGRAA